MEVKDLNIIPSGDMPVIHASQFDVNRTIKFNLKEDGEDYTLESGITITCVIKKVDGNLVTFEVTNTEGKYIELTLPEQATACAGINVGEVILTDEDDYEIGTINFKLFVKKSPKLGGIESDSAIHDLTTQIEEITFNVITSDPDIIATLKEEIDVPTKTSQLQNDSGYITSDDIPTIPTKTSQLQNDSGYITSDDIPAIPTKTSQLQNDSCYITSNDIPAIPSQLSDLSDIDIDNITNGQILKYNSTTEKFENADETGGGGSISYSTTEHEIGKWVDNSTIYEKSFYVSKSFGTGTTQALSASDLTGISKIVNVEIALFDTDRHIENPFYYTMSTSGNLNLVNISGSSRGTLSGYITLRYLK